VGELVVDRADPVLASEPVEDGPLFGGERNAASAGTVDVGRDRDCAAPIGPTDLETADMGRDWLGR
jgi:hypothetical protein